MIIDSKAQSLASEVHGSNATNSETDSSVVFKLYGGRLTDGLFLGGFFLLNLEQQLLFQCSDLVGVLLGVVALNTGDDLLGLLLHLTLHFPVRARVQHLLVAGAPVGVRLRHMATQLLVHWESGVAVLALVLVIGSGIAAGFLGHRLKTILTLVLVPGLLTSFLRLITFL